MAGMTADAVYVLLGNEIVLLTEKIEQMGGWEPLEHKGTVQTAEDLPTDAKKGWMYNIATDSIYGAAGMNVVMTSEGWDSMGPIINMALYLTKEEAEKSYQPKGNYLSGTDSTLAEPGKAADAKETGDKFSKTSADLEEKLDKNQGSENSGKIAGINESGDIVPMFPVGVEYNEETNCLEFGSDQGMKLNQGIGLDSTLTKTGFAADAGVTGKEINSLKEDISTKITKFYASSQGETHLADSDDGKIMDMMVYGRSEQEQYSGKNLLNATFKTDTYSGVALTNNGDGTYTIEGTNNSSGELTFPLVPTVDEQKALYNSLIGKNVKFIVESGSTISASVGRICFVFYNKTENRYSNETYNGGNVTVPTGYDLAVVDIHVNAGQTIPETILKPMIVDASLYPDTTYDDFEPYTGGIPSPNPDYPQEIKSVVNPTVKVCGKNFYSGSDLIDLTKAYVTDFMPVILHKGKICISFDAFSDTSDGRYFINVEYFDVNKEKIGFNGKAGTIGKNISHVSFEFDGHDSGNNSEALNLKNALYVKITFYIHNATATEITYKNIMVSATDSDFEPYKPVQTVTLPYTLNAIPVSSGGNVTIDGQQYIADYVDVERGKLVRMVGEFDTKDLMVFDRSETDGVYRGHFSDSMLRKFVAGNSFRTKLFDGESTPNATRQYSVYMDKNNKGQWLNFICDSTYRETADLKLFIQNTGTVYGIFETSEETDITEEELQSFKLLQAYYPTTNISINSEQLDGYTVFNYLISMANGWNYVKQQLNDNRDYIYDMDARTQDTDLQAAEAYVNSEYAVALTELEV